MITTHELKTDSDVFQAVLEGNKTYEIRRDDRNFKTSDLLILRETRFTGEEMGRGLPLEYTGRQVTAVVTHVLRGQVYGLVAGWVLLSIKSAKSV